MIMNNSKGLYQIRKHDGQLEFSLRKKLQGMRSKPDSAWNHGLVLVLIVIICGAVDTFNFKQVFDSFLFDRPLARVIGIAAFLLAYDLVPLWVGMDLKKKSQGYKGADSSILITMTAVCALAFAANLALRIVTKDMVLPDMESIFSGDIYGEVSENNNQSNSDLANVYAVFGSIVPVITSLASLTISFVVTDPLRKEKNALERQYNHITTRINELRAVISEYECNSDFQERIKSDDLERYLACREEIEAHRQYLIDYTHQRIKEHEGNPTSTNILSKPHLKAVV